MRAKLAVIVDRLMHGYDEEEICYALRMCSWLHVRVWRPGKPTAMRFSRMIGSEASVDEGVSVLNG